MDLHQIIQSFNNETSERTNYFFEKAKGDADPNYFFEHYFDFLAVLLPPGQQLLDLYCGRLSREQHLAFADTLQKTIEEELGRLKEKIDHYHGRCTSITPFTK